MTFPYSREGVERFLEEVLATEVPRLQRESDASLLAHQHGNAGADLRADRQAVEVQRLRHGAGRLASGDDAPPAAAAAKSPGGPGEQPFQAGRHGLATVPRWRCGHVFGRGRRVDE